MKRQMLVINIVLLAAAVGMAVKLRADWRRANQRYRVVAAFSTPAPGPSETGARAGQQHPGWQTPFAATPARNAGSQPPAPGVAPGTDLDVIVQRNLFAPDRNNELPKAAERKPAPPEPLLIGTLNLGRGKVALMAEASAPGAMSRQVKEGETFAGYKLVSIDDQQVTLEYEGQRKKVDVSTAARQVPAPAAVAAARPAGEPQVLSTSGANAGSAASNSQSTTTIPSSSGPAGPNGNLIPGTTSMYGHKDNLPAGTVIGDRRKVIEKTPFGERVWWELIQPEGKKP